MPTTYGTPELAKLMTDPTGLTGPDRRMLIYLVSCPETDEHCTNQDCEYGACVDADANDAEQSDGNKTEPNIHIAAIPSRYEQHPLQPIDYPHQLLSAAAEAGALLDSERLQELDELQQPWLEGPDEKQCRSDVIQTMIWLVANIDEQDCARCATCTKPHVTLDREDCPGCERLKDPNAERHEFRAG